MQSTINNSSTKKDFHSNFSEEIKEEAMSIEMPIEKFRHSVLDQSKEYPPPQPVIEIIQAGERTPMLTLKSLSLWQGKQKSKKTTVLAIVAAAFIKGANNESSLFAAPITGTVIYFDNEQGESYAARTMKLILKIAGLKSSPKLIYCDLREYTPTERKQTISAGIEATSDCKLVIIDGLVDLLNDFMDASEGHLSTTDILKWCSTYNVHIAGVLHQNKSDKNARAHIGTISSQKCEIEISTEVDKNDRTQSIVTCVNSRGIPFEPFTIRWEKGSLPAIYQQINFKNGESKSNKNYLNAKEIVESIFKPLAAIPFNEAIKRIMNTTQKSESTAKRLMNDFRQWDFIVKGNDGNYRINIPGSEVQEGSNIEE